MNAPLVVALGDPSGIGPEIVAKAWVARESHRLPPFFAVGDARSIEMVWRGPIVRISNPDEAEAHFSKALPVLEVADQSDIRVGEPDLNGARCALETLELSVGLARSGNASGLVTGPVCKATLYEIGFTHCGQTEFVAERCGVSSAHAVMLLAGPGLKVVPVTTHIPLREVVDRISIDLVVAQSRTLARGLVRNFGIHNPRLAFAGFNPHAGEQGAMGREEIDILEPAIALLQAEGIDAIGPLASDTMFHARAREAYDVAVCLYHDQALIPIKTLYFDDGVNMTLGLPIVRTAPDHGTAFNIAGKGAANPGAMIAAIRMAASAVQFRALNP